MASTERVFVGLGANLGDARGTLAEAIAAIAAWPGTRLVAASSMYGSAPVDAQGPDFVNAAIELSTTLEPQALLQALQRLEMAQGRQRPYRHAPRTLDLDLLLYGQRQIDTAELTVPHPRLHERAFVLQPLLELAPDLVHPRLGLLSDWARKVAGQPVWRLP